jgi:V8-like Glu-specific endopeptidase
VLDHPNRLPEQKILLREFEKLPDDDKQRVIDELRQKGVDLPDDITRLVQEGKLLPKKGDLTIFRVIQDELKPIPIGVGGLDPVFPASRHPWGRSLTPEEIARLMTAARSVGRIEETNNTPRLYGSAFVVGDGLIATNCHVLRQIAERTGDNWNVANNRFRIDFGELSGHNGEREFAILGIAGYPTTQFLDVALLRVQTTSTAGNQKLPAPLAIARSALSRDWAAQQLLVGVIGYPDLLNLAETDTLTAKTYRRIWESGDRAKMLSLGAVTGVDKHEGLDFLNHVASTHRGQSGSPVIDRETGRVVGVHYCCSATDVPQSTNPLTCSSQLVSDRNNNEAVSAWTVAGDRIVGPLLPAGQK